MDIPLPDVRVIAVGLDVSPEERDGCVALLADDERRRYDRLRIPRARDRFAVARASLRRVLAAELAADPRDLAFAYGPTGKPTLREPVTDLAFNLSHSSALALIALTRGRDIGVDVERVRPMGHADAMARRYFAPRECEALERLPIERRRDAFFACWTRKEAYIKAIGSGVFRGLHRFVVSVDPDQPAALLHVDDHPDEPARWQMHALRPAPGYLAALAIATDASPLG